MYDVFNDALLTSCIYTHTHTHRLFHIVVDSDRTASQILSIMNKQKLHGEVTFLPLNKLRPPSPDYPSTKVTYMYMYVTYS